MHLRAIVCGSTGRTRHSIGAIIDGLLTPVKTLPTPAWVEILEGEGAFYLLHFDAQGVCFAETCHQTLDKAKQQALFEFAIEPNEWSALEVS